MGGIFLIGLASAATQDLQVTILENDVAYVYSKNFRIDRTIVSAFNELGFDVVFVNEQNLAFTNLSRFRFVFIGDEVFRNSDLVRPDMHRSIIVNYYHADTWGLTDGDGASQLGGTTPLSVRTEGQVVQVYTQAFRRARISVPYYFLGQENVASSLVQVASAVRTSSGTLGHVISYVLPGTILANGRTAQQPQCYFGIVESEFWTPAAKDLFRNCVQFVAG